MTNPLIGMGNLANVSKEIRAKIREQAATGVSLLSSIRMIGRVVISFGLWMSSPHHKNSQLPDRKSKNVKLHPNIKKMIGEDVLMKIGARGVSEAASKAEVKAKIVRPKKKAKSSWKKAQVKRKVN